MIRRIYKVYEYVKEISFQKFIYKGISFFLKNIHHTLRNVPL